MTEYRLALLGQTCIDNLPHLQRDLVTPWQIGHWVPGEPLDALNALTAGADVIVTGSDALLTGHVFKAIAAAERLKFLQLPFAGFDWLKADLLPAGSVACNAMGHEQTMAEYVLAAILEWEIGLRKMDADFRAGSWRYSGNSREPQSFHGEIYGKTLGLFGFGNIGREIVKRAEGFGLRTIAVARSERTPAPDGLEWYGTQSQMDRLLAESDYLALVCDLNEETRHAVDAVALAKMKSSAVLINVARGPVAEEQALYEALRSRTIAGAVLDTWYTYPFRPQPGQPKEASPRPSRFPYHELDNLIMTPHCSAHSHGADIRRWHSIADNLNRYAEGRPLVHVIMKSAR